MSEHIHMLEAKFIASMQQAFGNTHSHFISLYSTFGSPYFMYIFYFPIVFNVDGPLGCHMIWISCLTEWLNTVLKWTFHGHRPYWWVAEHGGPALQQFPLTCETGPGSPSGHMMFTVSVGYSMLYLVSCKAKFNKFMTDGLAALLTLSLLMVALSRMYLAAHFPHQVICGAIAGYYVGRYLEKLETSSLRLSHYILMSLVILAVGAVMYVFMKLALFNPLWSVEKAEQFCTVPNAILHKHNVWAAFIRCAGTILGVGFGLWLTDDKSLWRVQTPTWLRAVGSLLSVVLAQLSAHHINVSHHQHYMFYSSVAAKGFGTSFVVIVIASVCRRIGVYLETSSTGCCVPCPPPRRRVCK